MKRANRPLLSACKELSHPTQQVQKKKKIRQTAIACHTRLDGQHCPLRTHHGAFSMAEKPSEDINSRLFLKNKKG
jgi:hypothetical protein